MSLSPAVFISLKKPFTSPPEMWTELMPEELFI